MVSVITISRINHENEIERKLSKTVRSVLENFNSFSEYILVVSNCTDKKKDKGDFIKAISKALPQDSRLKIVKTDCENSNWSSQRNRGIKEAKSDVVVFIDDEMTVEKGSIEELISTLLEDENIAAVCGAVLPEKTKNPIGKSQGILLHPGGGFSMPKEKTEIKFFHTGFSALRRNIFLQTPFDESLKWGCEDMDISIRLKKKNRNLKFFYVPSAVSYHPTRETIREIFHWMRRYGKGRADIYIRHGERMSEFFLPKLLGAILISALFPPISLPVIIAMYKFYLLKLLKKHKEILRKEKDPKLVLTMPIVFFVMNIAFDTGRIERIAETIIISRAKKLTEILKKQSRKNHS